MWDGCQCRQDTRQGTGSPPRGVYGRLQPAPASLSTPSAAARSCHPNSRQCRHGSVWRTKMLLFSFFPCCIAS